jgi:hypothetical protein
MQSRFAASCGVINSGPALDAVTVHLHSGLDGEGTFLGRQLTAPR